MRYRHISPTNKSKDETTFRRVGERGIKALSDAGLVSVTRELNNLGVIKSRYTIHPKRFIIKQSSDQLWRIVSYLPPVVVKLFLQLFIKIEGVFVRKIEKPISLQDIQIVPSGKSDLEDVERIYRASIDAFRKSRGGLVTDREINQEQLWSIYPFGLQMHFKGYKELLVAKIGPRVIGSIGYSEDSTLRDDSASIRMFFVDPRFQGVGVGTMLFGKIVERMKERGYNRVHLYSSLDAHGFYEKIGLVHKPEHDLYPKMPVYDHEIVDRLGDVCNHTSYAVKPKAFYFELEE